MKPRQSLDWLDACAARIPGVGEKGLTGLLRKVDAATAKCTNGNLRPNSERVDQVQAHINGYTKLVRAYVSQMGALRKHRNCGKQTVTVQHVKVQDGGQAIVGTVGDRGRAHEEK